MRTFRGMVAAVALSTAAIGLAGCANAGGGSNVTPVEVTPATIPRPLGRVASLEDLRAAAAAAGLACSSVQPDFAVNASESGSCSSSDRLLVYAGGEGLRTDVEYLTTKTVGTTLLVGPNWVVNSPRAPQLQAALGGAVMKYEAPTAKATPTFVPPSGSYGQWHEHGGLRVKITTPKRAPSADDGVCEPWKVTMTVRNTSKKKKDLYSVKYFRDDTPFDPMTYNLGDRGGDVPGDKLFNYIEPGQTRTYTLGICPINQEFDLNTPMELDILGDTDALAVNLTGAN